MKRLMATTAMATAMSVAVGAGPVSAQQQPVNGPVATYWMTAQTSSGFPSMGGGRIDPMAMMRGGGVSRTLTLDLEAHRTVSDPTAEHVPPAALGMGDSLPLVSPRTVREARDPGQVHEPNYDQMGEAPRMLIYFGCGDTARNGQPIEIRLTRENFGQLSALSNAIRLTPARGPSAGEGRTYGTWPNERTREAVPADSSLIGDHLVRGNYTPDIRFSLGADRDFLEPLQLTGVDREGANQLGWRPVPHAKGYFATAMGANAAGDVVVWSSSDIALMPMHIPDILTPGDLDRLLADKVVLPASATECHIPTAVTAAVPQAMLRVVAFGGEANFSYPERPADRRQPWNIEYAVKVRYASTAGMMLGMETPDMQADLDGAPERARPEDAVAIPAPGEELVGAVARGIGGLLRRRR